MPPRPLTHDLLVNVLSQLDAQLTQVVVTDIQEHTFFAELVLRRALDQAFAALATHEERSRWVVAGAGRLDRRAADLLR